ncbi:MAG: HDIG domain-containing protein [Clostridiaceae bacterium]|jgi:putative nucleotidyltransferase with HDIG domain|nr:HDIG domain-containing protein [Clostridiaceae bacterium]
MDRERAYAELKARLVTENLIKHSLAVEAIMRKLAAYFQEDVELWGLAGLLHDIDYDRVGADPEKHGIIGAEILDGLNVDHTVIYAVKSHNPQTGTARRRKMDKALFCSDPLSGLITACALILPDKKLEGVTTEFVLKKFKENSFAKGANREQIMTCEEIGLTLEKFIELGLEAMKDIHEELGL